MSYAELIAACRERAPKGCSWMVVVEFWHMAHDGTGALKWRIWRDDRQQHYDAATPQAALANAFPVMAVEDGLALVGEPTNADLQAQADAQRDAEAGAAEQDLLAMQVPK